MTCEQGDQQPALAIANTGHSMALASLTGSRLRGRRTHVLSQLKVREGSPASASHQHQRVSILAGLQSNLQATSPTADTRALYSAARTIGISERGTYPVWRLALLLTAAEAYRPCSAPPYMSLELTTTRLTRTVPARVGSSSLASLSPRP
jgi:hypothetical protein